MKIENKEAFKAELKKKMALHIKQFPVFFYGNLIINIIIVVLIVVSAIVILLSLYTMRVPQILAYGGIFIVILSSIFARTFRDFLKNVRVLNAIRAGHYDLGIEDFELDDVIEFFEQLPLSKSEVDRMKVELSFGKLIDVLDLFGVITCEGGVYELDAIYEHQAMGDIDDDIDQTELYN